MVTSTAETLHRAASIALQPATHGPVVPPAPLGAPQSRLLQIADAEVQVVGAALFQPASGSLVAAVPIEVVQISTAAVMGQMAAVLSKAVGQVAATLAVMPGTALLLSLLVHLGQRENQELHRRVIGRLPRLPPPLLAPVQP